MKYLKNLFFSKNLNGIKNQRFSAQSAVKKFFSDFKNLRFSAQSAVKIFKKELRFYENPLSTPNLRKL